MPTSTEEGFETELERLEQVVRELETGGVTLDAALARYEEGVKLARACRTRLETVERKVEELLTDGTTRPLDVH
ncbi:MAG TPA: exodeoxyribonuclease VII small subunit [Candidatus Thermoplasmatota archaeon]|nr:exodeoxyribonuclease VII small subunit [Candidatus Thermoplasmatota archaeon]